jgi:hypothetical protein
MAINAVVVLVQTAFAADDWMPQDTQSVAVNPTTIASPYYEDPAIAVHHLAR